MNDDIFVPAEKDQAVDNLISAWLDLLELRDLETKAHTERVTQLAVQLAKRLGFDQGTQEKVYFGARLHDIGKIGIQDSILFKPGKLTEKEFIAIQQHPLLAYKMMADSPYLVCYTDIPLYHHERWDGEGYPFGKKREEIPIEARLFSIVDAWDAITSDRPYRKAFPENEAIRLIQEGRNTQFDPRIVDCFLEMMQEQVTAEKTQKLILVIDDDDDLRLGLIDLLEREGYICRGASNGREGLSLIETILPSLIICDIMMPKMNGFEFRKALPLMSQDLEDVPFIYLTARSNLKEEMEAYQLKIDDYLSKPFDPDELLAKVKAILRRSDIVKRQEQLIYTDRLSHLQRFISHNATHELKSPLGIVIGNLELAIRKLDQQGSSQISPYLTDAQAGARRLQKVIDDLIYIYKVDNHLNEEVLMRVSVQNDVIKTAEETARSWKMKTLDLRFDVDETLAFIVPHDAFVLTVSHLVDNGCKFAAQNGKVLVNLHSKDKKIMFFVENDGSTIPPPLRQTVFERFFQISNGDTRDYPGLGLGLTIAKNFVDLVGGNIEILDGDLGIRVCIQIPILNEEMVKEHAKTLKEAF